jgi:uncharacterized membrane protein
MQDGEVLRAAPSVGCSRLGGGYGTTVSSPSAAGLRPVRRAKYLSFEDLRASLWFTPSVAAVLALAAALALAEVAPKRGPLADLPWPGDAEAASNVLQVIATTIIPVTSLTFSLVVVALQLASQQFSPRLLREFTRDWVIQAVLAILVAAFVFALTVLLGLNSQEPVPKLAVVVAFLLSLASTGALLAFLGHIVRSLRIDTMMAGVHGETVATLEEFYPRLDEPEPQRPGDLPGPDGAAIVPSPRSGFVKVVSPDQLVGVAEREDVVLWMTLRPGDHVIMGSPLGTVCRPDGSPVPDEVGRRLAPSVLEAVELGYERTSEQDTAFGLRQLADVAVKALSPGINDPVTAAHAVGYIADLLVRLHRRRLGPVVHSDAGGRPRVVLPDRDHVYYLELACAQIRRYGRREPTVLIALLRMLRDVSLAVHDADQAEQVRRQVRLILAEMAEEMLPEDAVTVRAMAERVEQVLRGDVADAYADRAGETRSL